MIAIKEAVSRSYDALKDMELVPETADVELEEAELEGNSWVVTLSYPEPIKPAEIEDAGPNLRAMLGKRRAYKAIRILATDGSILGIKSIHV